MLKTLLSLWLLAIPVWMAHAGDVDISITIVPGPRPVIVTAVPAAGATVAEAKPRVVFTFNVDMDISRNDRGKITLPGGLISSELLWHDPRTLEVLYTGSLTTGVKTIKFTDGYFIDLYGQTLPPGSQIAFQVKVGGGGDAPPGVADSDNDGFSDDLENEIGTDPNDDTSVPVDFPVTPPLPLTVSSMRVNLNFLVTAKDSMQLKGSFKLPDSFLPGAHRVAMDIGGIVRVFNLSKRGQGQSIQGDAMKLSYRAKKGIIVDRTGKFTLKLKGTLAASLVDEGMTAEPATRAARSLRVHLICANSWFMQDKQLQYTVKKGKAMAK